MWEQRPRRVHPGTASLPSTSCPGGSGAGGGRSPAPHSPAPSSGRAHGGWEVLEEGGRRREGGAGPRWALTVPPTPGGMVTPSLLSLLLHQPELASCPSDTWENVPVSSLCPCLLSWEVPSGAFVLEAEETGAQNRKGTCQQPHSNVGAEPGLGPACSLHPTTLPPTLCQLRERPGKRDRGNGLASR